MSAVRSPGRRPTQGERIPPRWKSWVGAFIASIVNPDAHFRHRFFGHLFTALFVVSVIGLLDEHKYLDRLKGAVLDLFSLSMTKTVAPHIVAADGTEIPLVEVLITDDEYQSIFQRTSPLARVQLTKLFQAWSAPSAAKDLPLGVAVDLDLSPSGLPGQADLEQALVALALKLPKGLVLAAPQGRGKCEVGECPDAWMGRMRMASHKKIAFGAPFASPHQYRRDKTAERLGVAFGRLLAGQPYATNSYGVFPLVTPAIPFQEISFSQALSQPSVLKGTAVVLGGRYDIRDTISAIDGERIEGSHAHALAALSEAYWLNFVTLPKACFLVLKVCIGIVVGWVLAYLWAKVASTGHKFFGHAAWYLAFLVAGLGLPAAVLLFSFELMKMGVDPTSLAVLMVGLLWDAAFSPQEDLLNRESADKRSRRYQPRKRDWVALGAWALLQWSAVICYLAMKFGPISIGVGVLLFSAMHLDGIRHAHVRRPASAH